MSVIKIITTESEEYLKILELRDWVLRMPLGMDIRNDDLSDEKDCQFLAYYTEDGQMIGCMKIKKIDTRTYQFQQMAVLQEYQGQGIGSELIKEAEALIKKQGGDNVIIESRDYAIPFYRKNGYLETGEIYRKINIPHQVMKKTV